MDVAFRKCGYNVKIWIGKYQKITMSVELKKAAYAGNVSGKFDNYAE